MELAKRVEHLAPTGAFVFLSRAKELEKQGKDIIHLEIGEPDFDTPINIKNAAIKAINDGYTKYVIGEGLFEIRLKIADYIKKTRNIDTNIDEIVVGAGGSSIVFFTILALVNPGDEVIYPDPGWFIYKPITILAGGFPKPYHLLEEKDFSIDVEEIKSLISDKTKLIIINSPHNPTGGMINEKDLSALAELLIDKNIWVMSDEVYSQIVYEDEFKSISSYKGMKEKTIIVESFSKTYAMTGWRLGYGVMNKTLAYKVGSLLINCNSCTVPFVQIAGIEALNGEQDEVIKMRNFYKRRRDIMVKGLNDIDGIRCVQPKGAFYVFPNIKDLNISDTDFAIKLLEEAGVCCLPGTAFGSFAKTYVRFTYSIPEDKILETLDRIKKFVKNL